MVKLQSLKYTCNFGKVFHKLSIYQKKPLKEIILIVNSSPSRTPTLLEFIYTPLTGCPVPDQTIILRS